MTLLRARIPFSLRVSFVGGLLVGVSHAQCPVDGTQTSLEYMPTQREVVLNTDFTQIQPVGGPPINVAGGVFSFRNVTIPEGVTVRGTGSNPMIWIVSGSFVVNGNLRVDGGNGQQVNTLNSANFPAAGGVGVCGGGNGGAGSPEATQQSASGASGFGPGQVPDVGGGGGQLAARFQCGRASGGGGGVFATAGDPHFKWKKDPDSVGFIQQTGVGGYGCSGFSGSSTRTLPGGAPGMSVFTDARADNDFFGVGVNYQTGEVIRGELPFPIGGQGGGGGGDLTGVVGGTNWIIDNKGGGGGGGGGVLIICAPHIEVGPRGWISANGGHGGGGEQAGGNNQGGGGAGGSGGMVILVARDEIVLYTHGDTYAKGEPRNGAAGRRNGAYRFSVSADGGVGTQGVFGGVAWEEKYPPGFDQWAWDANPAGGFGGMGIVQMVTRPGNNQDGTNTVLDDSIHIVQRTADGVVRLTGDEKERYIAWRGYPNERGVWVDDFNAPTYNNDPAAVAEYPSWALPPAHFPPHVLGRDSEGDIRPAPVLLPLVR